MATATKDRLGVGCLALFALPFAAVGIVALYLAGSHLFTWARMTGWQAVPAQLLSVELVAHDGDDSTTYEVAARYRYSFAGRSYERDRVAISGMADNVGTFQRDLYDRLGAEQLRGGATTAFVDPDDPGSATLSRDLRTLLLALELLFGIVFGGVGFGLIGAGLFGSRKLEARRELERLHPGEPWRWRRDWAEGRIRSTTRATAYGAAAFALLWNAVALPAALFVPGEIAKRNYAALIALLFPIIGIGLAAWAARAWAQMKRFKVATLTLTRTPVAVGGRLRGAIRVDAQVPVEDSFRLDVSCIERRRSGNRDSETSEHIVWQRQWTVPRNRCERAASYTSIPVDVAIPNDVPSTSADDTDRISWRLEASGACPGPDFWARFELPVFGIEERAPEAAAEQDAQEDGPQQPDPRTLASLGIVYEQLAQGAESWTFRRARHKSVAFTLSALSAIFGGAAVFLWFSDASIVLPIAFAAFDALLVWWTLHLWFTEYRVTLDGGLLTVARRGIVGASQVTEIPRQWIKSVRAQRGMQAGNKLYYDLRIDTADDSVTAASSLGDYSVASWLAQRWANGA
jgi:hypothetical protein